MVEEYSNLYYADLFSLLNSVYDSTIDQQTLEKNYIGKDKHILVAINKNNQPTLIGCAFVEFQYDYVRPKKIGYVTYVAVNENFRHQGIGKELMSAVENLCKYNNCSAIELTSANFRTKAHLFYDSLGFTKKATTVFIKEIN